VLFGLNKNKKWFDLNLNLIMIQNIEFNYLEYLYISLFYILKYYDFYNIELNIITFLNLNSFIYSNKKNKNLQNKIICCILKQNEYIKLK